MTVERADEAARSVLTLFGGRLRGLPGTHLAVTARPGPPPRPWHYWWQAHLLDCMVDAHARGSATVPGGLIGRHLRGIRLRNWGRLPNRFYDDMAWLALAAHRAGRRTPSLDRALREALTDNLGGGAFWSLDRDVKNTAATGPIALHLARTGHRDEASRLHDWLRANLEDPRTGLFRDGLRLTPAGPTMVPHVFTYNQGPVLGAMLELGRLDEAASHVQAVATHLTHPGTRLLTTHGGGDGGLFTGILTRYLALAASDTRLPTETREVASGLVNAFADAVWQGRDTRGWRGRRVTVFPPDTTPTGAPRAGHTVELATQLQAWTAFEAATSAGRG